jgi:hypothetical protein
MLSIIGIKKTIKQHTADITISQPRRLHSVETTYGINSVVSKLMIIVEIAETGQFLFLTMLILSCFTCS